MDILYEAFFRKLIDNADSLSEYVDSLYEGSEYSEDDLNHIFGVLKNNGLITCMYADNRAWVHSITFQGKHYFDQEQEAMSQKQPKIFISHSSKDVAYVAQIVNLLDGIGLNQTLVFCSSLPGYGIPIDTNIFDYLRDQFLEYNLHVIFVHSDNYYKSPVSLNEMGAAWALKSAVTSFLLPGFSFNKMTGVVNNQSIAIKLDGDRLELQDKLNQLHDKIVTEFNLTKKADIIWQQKRDSFIREIQDIGSESSQKSGISEDVEMLLESAATDPTGTILKVFSLSSGTSIQGGSTTMNENASQRESARWIAALDELIACGYASQADKKGEVFRVTDAGYKAIENKQQAKEK